MAEPGGDAIEPGSALPALAEQQLPAAAPSPSPAPAPPPATRAGAFGPVAFFGALAMAAVWLWLLVSPEMRAFIPPTVALTVGLGVAGAAWLGGGALDRSAFGQRFAALASGDPFRLPWGLGFVILYFAARAPWLPYGYGGDPDAWRVAASGIKLWKLGVYEVSRFPGYPVVEIGLSPFVVLGGPLAANAATAAVGLLGLLAMDRAGRRLGLPSMGLVTLSVAFAPIFLVNTANTMDYVYALAGLQGALWALCAGRYGLAGLLFGLAVGCRLPTVVFAAPLGLWVLFGRRASVGEVARFVLASAVTAIACYVPVVWEYGPRFFTHTNPEITESTVSEYTLWATGVLPPLLFGGALADALRGRGRGVQPEVGDGPSNGLLLAGLMAVVLGLYAYLPIQSGYLLPALPFGAMLVARLATPASLAALGLALAVSNAHDLSASPLRDLTARRAIIAEYDQLRAAPVPPGSVVMLGGAAYATTFVLGTDLVWSEETPWPRSLNDQARDIIYMSKLTERQMAKGLDLGKHIFVYNQEVDAWSVNMMGFSPVERGATLLGIGEKPTKKGKDKGKDKGKGKAPATPAAAPSEAAPAPAEATPALNATGAPAEPTTEEPAAEAKTGTSALANAEVDQAARWIVNPPKKAGTIVRWLDNRTRIESTRTGIPVSICSAGTTHARSRVKVLGEYRVKEPLDMEGLRLDLLWLDDKEREVARVVLVEKQTEAGDWVELKEFHEVPKGATRARLCATLESRTGEVALDDLELQQVR